MTTIDITGIVGYDTDLDALRAAFDGADGAIQVRLHSPGGDVTDGIAIHNLIRAARRAGHAVTVAVTGLAASMATYIAMAADRVEVEDNAVFMTHNPWTLAMGDYRDMEKSRDILSGLTRILARAYADKTGRDLHAIRQEMDAETWLYGADIVDAGYADAVIPAGDGPEDAETAFALARTAFGAMRHALKTHADESAGLDRIAAMLPLTAHEEPDMSDPTPAAVPDEPQTPDTPTEPTAPAVAPDPAPVAPEPAPAAPADLQAAIHSALAQERARAKAIRARCEGVRMAHLADALIESGADLAAANAAIVDAWTAQGGPEIRQTTAAAAVDPLDAAVAAYQAAHPGTKRPHAVAAVIQAHPSLYDAHRAAVRS